MSLHSTELKAALPSDFSGKNDDATRWIKAMKVIDDFESTFYPFDTKITAHNQLHALRQRFFKEKDGSTNDGFQQYITNFQNLSMKAGTKDEFNLISQFSLGLDQKLSEMILSMSSVPTTSKGWINQSKIFHTQLVRIRDLHKG